ncbi:hypothetical protein CH75_19605 [Dyella jiangningensis]|nr:hypothetical protein CH75_19605 [Dyella jiangningensis]
MADTGGAEWQVRRLLALVMVLALRCMCNMPFARLRSHFRPRGIDQGRLASVAIVPDPGWGVTRES